jgi:hypothetical protein
MSIHEFGNRREMNLCTLPAKTNGGKTGVLINS